jgi:hypothetical protein
MYVPITGFYRVSHRCSDGQNLLHSGTEKKDNVAFSAERSVTASLVGGVAECLIRVATDEVAGTVLTGKTIAFAL